MVRTLAALLPVLFLMGTPVQADEYDTGIQALKDGKFERGIEVLLPLAESGDTRAQSVLAALHVSGRAEDLDTLKILAWLKEIANGSALPPVLRGKAPISSRFPREEYFVGAIYLRGKGVPSDYAEALTWLRRSADGGFPPSFYLLGLIYKTGQGEKRSDDGKVLLRKGVYQDEVLAYMWLKIASFFKGTGGERELAELDASMDAEDRAEGERLAKDWLRNYLAIRDAKRQRR